MMVQDMRLVKAVAKRAQVILTLWIATLKEGGVEVASLHRPAQRLGVPTKTRKTHSGTMLKEVI